MLNRKTIRCDLAFLLCLLAAAALLIWKAPFGICTVDESFYLTIPYRMAQGDILLADEWNMSQMTGLLLYPAMKLFCLLSPSTDGIILAFRYVYIAAQAAASAYIYLRLRRLSPLAAIPAALVFMLYTPFNVMALSYNTMGLMLLTIACVTMATTLRRLPDALISGLAFAGAVLCCPYLLIVYGLYCLCVLLRRFCAPSRRFLDEAVFTPSFWLWFTLGAALLALALLLPLLFSGRIGDAVNSLPEIMNGDGGGHQLGGSLEKIPQFFTVLTTACPLAIPVYLGFFVLLVVILRDKNAIKHRSIYMLIALLLAGIYYAYFVFSDRYINFLMFPLCLAGPFAYLLSEHRNRRIFSLLYLPGVLYSFCIHLSSNQLYYNISSAMALSCLASVFLLARLALEIKAERSADRSRLSSLASLAVLIALLLQLGLQAAFRARYCFWDEPPAQLSHEIDRGPGKGVRTTEALAQVEYYLVYDDTAAIRESGYGHVLYYSNCTWLYLADDARSASFSAWLTPGSEAMERRYWEHYPERLPDCIYILKSFGGAKSAVDKLDPGGMDVTETSCGYILTPSE